MVLCIAYYLFLYVYLYNKIVCYDQYYKNYKMKNSKTDKLLKIILMITIMMSMSFESKAQVWNINNNVNRILSPIVNFTTQTFTSDNSLTSESNSESGYFDQGFLLLKENIAVCKDILSCTLDSVENEPSNIIEETKPKCEFCQDSTNTKKNTSTIITQKKRPKTFRNNPGNIRSRI